MTPHSVYVTLDYWLVLGVGELGGEDDLHLAAHGTVRGDDAEHSFQRGRGRVDLQSLVPTPAYTSIYQHTHTGKLWVGANPSSFTLRRTYPNQGARGGARAVKLSLERNQGDTTRFSNAVPLPTVTHASSTMIAAIRSAFAACAASYACHGHGHGHGRADGRGGCAHGQVGHASVARGAGRGGERGEARTASFGHARRRSRPRP